MAVYSVSKVYSMKGGRDRKLHDLPPPPIGFRVELKRGLPGCAGPAPSHNHFKNTNLISYSQFLICTAYVLFAPRFDLNHIFSHALLSEKNTK